MDEQNPQSTAPQPVDGYTPPDWNLHTHVDDEGIRATASALFPPKLRNTYVILGAVLILMGLAMAFIPDELITSIVVVVCGILTIGASKYLPSRISKAQIARMQETYHTTTIPFGLDRSTSQFFAVLTNLRSHAQVNLRYEMFRRIVVTERYMVLITTAKQSVLIDLNDVENRGHFVDYMRSKCPNAKWKTRRA